MAPSCIATQLGECRGQLRRAQRVASTSSATATARGHADPELFVKLAACLRAIQVTLRRVRRGCRLTHVARALSLGRCMDEPASSLQWAEVGLPFRTARKVVLAGEAHWHQPLAL